MSRAEERSHLLTDRPDETLKQQQQTDTSPRTERRNIRAEKSLKRSTGDIEVLQASVPPLSRTGPIEPKAGGTNPSYV